MLLSESVSSALSFGLRVFSFTFTPCPFLSTLHDPLRLSRPRPDLSKEGEL